MSEESTFVRKDFYIDPPGKDAKPAEWVKWLEADTKKASAAKAAHTKTLKHAPVPTWLGNEEAWQAGGSTDVSTGDGVHRQGNMVGFTGDAEEGTCQAERVDPMPLPDAMVDIKAALQEIALRTNQRGGSRKGKSARRHKNKKKGKK